MIKFTSIVAAAMITAGAASACEYKAHNINIDFNGTAPIAGACEGAVTAIKFFEDVGYDEQVFTVNITVTDAVYTYMTNENTGEEIPLRAFGLYDGESNQITISALGTDYMNSRTAWNTDARDDTSGMPITEEIWASVITHETAHALSTQVFNRLNPVMVSNGYFMPHGPSEYISYMIQLATTRDELRDEIIASFDNPTAFAHRDNLNPYVHFAHPHKYGVRAYLTQNMDWFHNALSGKFGQLPDW